MRGDMSMNHGFLILDKPTGITSAKAVGEVKRLLGCSKVGHGGTLDPLASGILPLAIGEATKAFDYVASARKSYRFTITFGESRDTDDAEGQITATTTNLPNKEALVAVLPSFIGRIVQTPPVYSALKVDGKRAYARARAGEAIVMQPRQVDVYSLALLEMSTPSQATLEVACGKGTYVRAMARDIAIKLNSLGYVSMLRRTRVGRFSEEASISLDKLKEGGHNAALSEAWISLELALDDIPAIRLNPEQTQRLRQGQALSVSMDDGRYTALCEDRLQAFVEVSGGRLRSLRIFNCD